VSASSTIGDSATLSESHVLALLRTKKPAYPSVLDASQCKLVHVDSALLAVGDVLKELDLSGNRVAQLGSLAHLSRLKRAVLAKNQLQAFSGAGLVSLELLNLAHNRLATLPTALADLRLLLHLDLSNNELGLAPSAAWAELTQLKSLRVLTLSYNKIAMAINEFYAFILTHLKKLAKLEWLAFEGNPIESSIASFSFFCIGELPKLKYMDWKLVSKKDRDQARVIEAQGTFDDHVLPPLGVRRAPSESMRAALEFGDSGDKAPAKLNPDLLGGLDLDFDELDEPDERTHSDSFAAMIDAVASGAPSSPTLAHTHEDGAAVFSLTLDIDQLISEAGISTRATNSTAAKLDAAISNQNVRRSSNEPAAAVAAAVASAAASRHPAPHDNSIDLLLDELSVLNSLPSGRPASDAPPPVEPPPEEPAEEPPPVPDDSSDALLDSLLSSLQERRPSAADQVSRIVAAYESPPPSPPPAAAATIAALPPPPQQPRTYSAPSPPPSPPPAARIEPAAAPPSPPPSPPPPSPPPAAVKAQRPVRDVPPPVSPTPRASQLAAIEKPTSRPENVKARVRESAKATIAGLHGSNIIEETRRRELERAEIDALKEAAVVRRPLQAAAPSGGGMDALDALLQGADAPDDAAPVNADFRVASRDTVEFLARLGLGTYGDAYQGMWRGDAVVLKKLRQQMFQDDFLREFSATVRALANVSHPNLLRPIAVLIELDVCAITPYVVNGNLKAMLESATTPLNGSTRVHLALQIAGALEYLHARDIVHRTLTPTNVLVDEQNRVLISDYGLCELKDSIRYKTQQLGRQVAYFAPELFPCERADMLAAHLYDRKVDVYAFGMLLWTLWSRVEPFATLMPRDVPPLIRQGKRPPLADAKAPHIFEKLITACWHDEPAQRPEFAAVARVLQQPDEMLLGERRAEAPVEALSDMTEGERKLAAVVLRLCEMLASSDAAARLKAAEMVVTLAANAQSDRVFAATPLSDRLAALLATRGAGVDVFNAVMRAVEAIAALPLTTERVRRAAILPTLLAAARVAPLRDAALAATGALARQSARVRDALRPLDGLVVFGDVLRSADAGDGTRALAAWCAAAAMIDPNVREDAVACQLPEALAAHMSSSNVVLSARCLEALTRLLEGPAPAAKFVLHLQTVPVLIKPVLALRAGTGQMSALVVLAVRGLLAAVRSGLGGELGAHGVTRQLLQAIPRQDAQLASHVDEIVAALERRQ
jgi:hypothetical protein